MFVRFGSKNVSYVFRNQPFQLKAIFVMVRLIDESPTGFQYAPIFTEFFVVVASPTITVGLSSRPQSSFSGNSELSLFCQKKIIESYLKPHAKYQNLLITLSERKLPEEKERKEAINRGHYIPKHLDRPIIMSGSISTYVKIGFH